MSLITKLPPKTSPAKTPVTAQGNSGNFLLPELASQAAEDPYPDARQKPALDLHIDIRSTIDIVTARQHGRELALELGFAGSEITLVAAAISEIARNILDHAKRGEINYSVVAREGRRCLQIIAQDRGPGISDIQRAMQYGYSTRGGLGVGLPGAKWLMDEFEIDSNLGEGTRVIMRKWIKHDYHQPSSAA